MELLSIVGRVLAYVSIIVGKCLELAEFVEICVYYAGKVLCSKLRAFMFLVLSMVVYPFGRIDIWIGCLLISAVMFGSICPSVW